MIGIIDYGCGNLFSLKNAMEYIGEEAIITNDKEKLSSAEKLILPGVGAFPDAMKNLDRYSLTEFIKTAATEKPILGICLGMQILLDEGTEFEACKGLSLVSGKVVPIEKNNVKVPHMGWNQLIFDKDSPIIDGISQYESVYFVHSFKACAVGESLTAHCEYNQEIPAIISCGRIYGVQFHPEKSGKTGLKILRNFCTLA